MSTDWETTLDARLCTTAKTGFPLPVIKKLRELLREEETLITVALKLHTPQPDQPEQPYYNLARAIVAAGEGAMVAPSGNKSKNNLHHSSKRY